ncbi:MAG TPA: proline--tRNA ligase [Thermoanaerobaculia bacterium]|nr:proline--tRNA ligase [Thermoanaerobaculia bacterium]
MAKAPSNAISPTRTEDYAEWYQQVIKAADLAENAPVRGCMVIKPWGYALWENIQRELDAMFKATGHKNAYFPLFIPKSFMEKEAEHVEGFAKECAVVTHYRLVHGKDGGLIPDPDARLEEPLIVRPTSETIIGAMFAKWVQSYRDLPLLINQWCNIVRWELRTRMFLRTTEFLWQEGHTAHETAADAEEETRKILNLYADFAESFMAMPVIRGKKSIAERFPGAVDTYSIEAMMQDRKALQAGTSHFLGQNFARASEIKFQGREGTEEHAWTTSWGVSTRLIGGLIMTHSDDDGLVLPPKLAPSHVVILPIVRSDDTRDLVLNYVDQVAAELRSQMYERRPVIVEVDNRDTRGGQKQWEWIKKGVPVRLEIGPRDAERGTVSFARRDRAFNEKMDVPRAELPARLLDVLAEMQAGLFERAKSFRAANMHPIGSRDEFFAFFTPKNAERPEIHGGFAVSPWCGDAKCEGEIKEALKVTIRNLPLEPLEGIAESGSGKCVVCGKEKQATAVFAKSY